MAYDEFGGLIVEEGTPPVETPVAAPPPSVESGATDEFGGVLETAPAPTAPTVPTPEEDDEWGFLDYISAILEPIATVATGAVAEPLAGISGVIAGMMPGPEGQAVKAIERGRESITHQPQTEGGQAGMLALAEGIEESWVGDIMRGGKWLADKTAEYFGPEAGTIVGAAPVLVMEILGMKATRLMKKSLLGRTLRKTGIDELYDETGNMLPAVKKAIKESGMEAAEIADILPETLSREQVSKLAKDTALRSAKALEKGVTTRRGGKQLAEQVRPSSEIVEAAAELGLAGQLNPAHVSTNPVYQAIEKSVKGASGELNSREQALLKNIATKSDEIMEEGGALLDRGASSDTYTSAARQTVETLTNEADTFYDRVNKAVPKRTVVDTGSINGAIHEIIADAGGTLGKKGTPATDAYKAIPGEPMLTGLPPKLDAKIKSLLKNMDPESNPTYNRLDTWRKSIGQALDGKGGEFAEADPEMLNRLYGALAEDQKIAAIAAKVGDQYAIASDLTSVRKGMEKQLKKVLGPELTASIQTKGKSSMLALKKGEYKAFDELTSNIPPELGKAERLQVVATALDSAFKKDGVFKIDLFNSFMDGVLVNNKGGLARLKRELGPETLDRLKSLHKITKGIEGASGVKNLETITTLERVVDRLTGAVAKVAAGEVAGMVTTGLPGVGTSATLIGSAVYAGLKKKKNVVRAADNLLASTEFQNMVTKAANGAYDTPAKIKHAEIILERLKAYKDWKILQSPDTLEELASVGAIGYLTGEGGEE